MLLCPDCHHKIDTGKKLETVESLKKHKKQHEARVYHLTGLDKEHETHVVVIKSKIYSEIVDVADKDIYEAIAPYYPSETRCEIDLTTISSGINDACLTVGSQTIRAESPIVSSSSPPGQHPITIAIINFSMERRNGTSTLVKRFWDSL